MSVSVKYSAELIFGKNRLNFFSAERKGYYQYFRENCYNEKAPSILTCKKQTKQLIKEYSIDDYKASKLLID